MIKHALFPVFVAEFKYPEANQFKNIFYDNALKHFNDKGFSNERTGHVSIHHEPAFELLYKFLSKCVEQYLQALNVDTNTFDINFVKSWFNILKNQQTPLHSHGDAHISIVYYVNTPEGCNQVLRFHNYYQRIEPFPGSLRYNNPTDKWNELNSYTWGFKPTPGSVFIFPAQLMHDTVGNVDFEDQGIKTKQDLEQSRICIAADVVLSFNKEQAKPLGLQPLSNWKQFCD
jgi:uncharacterized protein (TIGR02466 family)